MSTQGYVISGQDGCLVRLMDEREGRGGGAGSRDSSGTDGPRHLRECHDREWQDGGLYAPAPGETAVPLPRTSSHLRSHPDSHPRTCCTGMQTRNPLFPLPPLHTPPLSHARPHARTQEQDRLPLRPDRSYLRPVCLLFASRSGGGCCSPLPLLHGLGSSRPRLLHCLSCACLLVSLLVLEQA